jgi:hypothetical protein
MPSGEKQLGQRANFVALVENGLLRVVWFGDQIFGIVSVPQQFLTLQSPQKF